MEQNVVISMHYLVVLFLTGIQYKMYVCVCGVRIYIYIFGLILTKSICCNSITCHPPPYYVVSGVIKFSNHVSPIQCKDACGNSEPLVSSAHTGPELLQQLLTTRDS